MKPKTLLILALLLIIPLGIAVYEGMLATGERVGDSIEARGLQAPIDRVRVVDEQLTSLVRDRLEDEAQLEGEIDFNNPTSQDIRFLLGMVRKGQPAQQKAAASALVQISDPRHSQTLLRLTVNNEQSEYFCLASLEILRYQTALGAAEFIVKGLLLKSDELSESCRGILEERLLSLYEMDENLLKELLLGEEAPVIMYVLRNIPAVIDEDVVFVIRGLAESSHPQIAANAKKQLDHLIPNHD